MTGDFVHSWNDKDIGVVHGSSDWKNPQEGGKKRGKEVRKERRTYRVMYKTPC